MPVAATAEATSAAAAEGEGEEWPQEYQLVVTLLDGGMVRDSPFNLLLLPEGFVFDDDHADVGAAPASLLGAPVTTPRGCESGCRRLSHASPCGRPSRLSGQSTSVSSS